MDRRDKHGVVLYEPERLAEREARIEHKEGRHSMSTNEPLWWVGIDVSKQWLDCACQGAGVEFRRWGNEASGLSGLIASLAGKSVGLVVLEASGGYETQAAAALAAAGIAVAVVNPKQVREFARATGVLAKTDRIDAGVLAQFGRVIRPAVRALPDAQQRDLTELVDRRLQLVSIRAQERAAGKPRTPIVMVTANAFESDRAAALAAGADDFMTKPYSEAELLGVIARNLGRARPAEMAPQAA